MSVNRHLCRSGRNIRPSVQHIWVGDDILDAAIQRFGRIALSRRNVGFAPGPLEARKRGTKRRLAYISQGNVGTVGQLDPSLLSGVNERAHVEKWSWQGPGVSRPFPPAPSSSWPSTLLEPPHPLLDHVPEQIEDAPDLSRQPIYGKEEDAYQENAFVMKRLGRCQSVDELRNSAAFYGIDVRRYSRPLFRRLWKATRSIKISVEFLENDRLDAPWAQNLGFLLDEAFQAVDGDGNTDHQRVEIVEILIPWIKMQLSLGRRSLSDIVALSQCMRRPSRDGYDEKRKRHLAISVLEGLQSSTVQSFKDLTPAVRLALFEAVVEGQLSNEILDLGLSLAETVNDLEMVSRFLIKCMRSRDGSEQPAGLDEWMDQIRPKIDKLLSVQTWEAANSIVKISSKKIIKWHANVLDNLTLSNMDGNLLHYWWPLAWKYVSIKSLEDWHEILEMERPTSSKRQAILSTCANSLCEEEQAKFMFFSWFFSRLPSEEFQKIYYILEQNLHSQTVDSSFCCMLRFVHAELAVEADFVRHVVHLLVWMSKTDVVSELIHKSDTINMHVTPEVFRDLPQDAVEDIVRHLLPVSFDKAHDIFKCDPRLSLESLPGLAKRLIKNNRINPTLVWLYRMKRQREPTEDTAEAKEDHRKARYRLLVSMAHSFSDARHLSLRTIQRHVGKCFNSIRREELGQLSKGMLVALMRSTVILPLRMKGKVSTQAVTNLLYRVREVEGSESADYIDNILWTWHMEIEKQKTIKRELEPGPHTPPEPLVFKFHRKWSYDFSEFSISMTPRTHIWERDTRPSFRPLRLKKSETDDLPQEPIQSEIDVEGTGRTDYTLSYDPEAPFETIETEKEGNLSSDPIEEKVEAVDSEWAHCLRPHTAHGTVAAKEIEREDELFTGTTKTDHLLSDLTEARIETTETNTKTKVESVETEMQESTLSDLTKARIKTKRIKMVTSVPPANIMKKAKNIKRATASDSRPQMSYPVQARLDAMETELATYLPSITIKMKDETAESLRSADTGIEATTTNSAAYAPLSGSKTRTRKTTKAKAKSKNKTRAESNDLSFSAAAGVKADGFKLRNYTPLPDIKLEVEAVERVCPPEAHVEAKGTNTMTHRPLAPVDTEHGMIAQFCPKQNMVIYTPRFVTKTQAGRVKSVYATDTNIAAEGTEMVASSETNTATYTPINAVKTKAAAVYPSEAQFQDQSPKKLTHISSSTIKSEFQQVPEKPDPAKPQPSPFIFSKRWDPVAHNYQLALTPNPEYKPPKLEQYIP